MFMRANPLMRTNVEINRKNYVCCQNDGKQTPQSAKMICIWNIYINSTFTKPCSPSLCISICFQIYPEKEYVITNFKLAIFYAWLYEHQQGLLHAEIAQSGTKRVYCSLRTHLLMSPKEKLLKMIITFWSIFYR